MPQTDLFPLPSEPVDPTLIRLEVTKRHWRHIRRGRRQKGVIRTQAGVAEWTELLRLLVRETKGGEVCQRMQHRIPVVSLHQSGLLLVLPSDLSQVTLQVAAVFSIAGDVPAAHL